jgi:hypothetical protein
MLQQAFVTQWSVFTPIIYRMMAKEYVDRFFATGELLVSSFDRFRQHADEERRDKEGWNIICGRGTKQTIFAVTGHDRDAFILCGTAAKDAQLLDAFGADAAIQIYDPTAFASVVTRQLPGVRQGFEGFCCYIDGSIECNIGDFELDQLKQSSGQNLDMNRLGGFVLNMAGLAVFFRKALKFRHQLEYRWVWITDHPVTDHIIIQAADARQFCAPLYRDEIATT